jgi:hypothetical protein
LTAAAKLFRSSASRFLLLSLGLAAIAYLPAWNNGFIADDYVILARAEVLKSDPLYLFSVPPDNFRLMTHVVFAGLKQLVGYQAPIFYLFSIGLHIVNIALLAWLLRLVTEDDFIAQTGALFFAVFQAPHEAVYWLTGMSETTLAFFALMTLLMWWRDRCVAAAICYTFALWSKESAVVILLVIALLDLHRKRPLIRSAHVLLLIPTLLSAGLFLYTFSVNSMIRSDAYRFSPQALIVLGASLHRLVWPWVYVILLFLWIQRRSLPGPRVLALYAGCVLVPMLPYMFIAYQSNLPSRQLYLASAVLMPVFAALLKPLKHTNLLAVFIVSFVGFNIGYLWLRKDTEFKERSLPTTELVETLRRGPHERTLVLNFAYRYPEIAYAAVWAVPGWTPDMIIVDRPGICDECRRLRWNSDRLRYDPQ